MKFKKYVKSILLAISLAMGISIIILSYFMDFACSDNIRYIVIYITIALICLSLAGITEVLDN
jgi:hypothetical protein